MSTLLLSCLVLLAGSVPVHIPINITTDDSIENHFPVPCHIWANNGISSILTIEVYDDDDGTCSKITSSGTIFPGQGT